MAKSSKATITHFADEWKVICEADSEGKQIVYLRFTGELLKITWNGTVDLQFALDMNQVIELIFELQKSAAWFHKFLTEEDHKRIAEAMAVTEQPVSTQTEGRDPVCTEPAEMVHRK